MGEPDHIEEDVPPPRGAFVRLLFVLGLLAGCVALSLEKEPRLGLDVKGGTQIMIEASSTEVVEANAESVDRAIEILRGRVDALGVAEPTLARLGETRILVELPDVQDPAQAVEVLGKTAQLDHAPGAGRRRGPEPRALQGGQRRPGRRGRWAEELSRDLTLAAVPC